ncbi:MAG: DinB family protein [Gemmatimonadaceae bacterium]
MKRDIWFERSFDFTIPVSRFPSILERLRATPARLEERTRSLPAAVLTRRDNDRWSIQENVGHLLDLEALWLRRAEQLFGGEAELAAADLTNRTTHDANYNTRALADLLVGFRTARTHLIRLLHGADEEMVARTARHPRLGTPMRLIDLGMFVAEHDDHHLAAITGLLR